jgi:hypothetical protein
MSSLCTTTGRRLVYTLGAALAVAAAAPALAYDPLAFASAQHGYGGRVYGAFDAVDQDASTVAVAAPGSVTVGGQLTLNVGVDAESNLPFNVYGIDPATPLTFHWAMAGGHGGAADATQYQMYFKFGIAAPTPWGGMGVEFVGLSYVDLPEEQGGFVGQDSGVFACTGQVFCGSSWDAQGGRNDLQVTDLFWDGSAGMAWASISVAGTGPATQAQYQLVLTGVSGAVGNGAYLSFADGRQMLISAVPEPSALGLLLGGVVLLGQRWRQRGAAFSAA